MKYTVALLVSFLIGAGCRYFNLPAPAPPKLLGVLLICAMTVGYVVTDRWVPSP